MTEQKNKYATILSGTKPYGVGDCLLKNNLWFVVVDTWSKYIEDDGLSLGLDDDSGELFSAGCRDATEEEIERAKQKLAIEQEKQQKKIKMKILRNKIFSLRFDDRPQKCDFPAGEKHEIDSLHTIVLTDSAAWLLRYNGADGDTWSANNCEGRWIATYSSQPETIQKATQILREITQTKGEIKP